jgi:Holliday junction resolvase RusA-like endonuclease
MKPITLFIAGDPIGQPRALCRAIRVSAKQWRAMVYEPEHENVAHQDPEQRRWARANVWKRLIMSAVRWLCPPRPFDFPIRLDAEFIVPRPAAHYGTGRNANTLRADAPYHLEGKPDRDNLDKIILDSITKIGRADGEHPSQRPFWMGDERVCDGRIIKRYQRDHTERTGVFIRISRAKVGASIFDDTDILDLIPTTDQLFPEPEEGAAA